MSDQQLVALYQKNGQTDKLEMILEVFKRYKTLCDEVTYTDDDGNTHSLQRHVVKAIEKWKEDYLTPRHRLETTHYEWIGHAFPYLGLHHWYQNHSDPNIYDRVCGFVQSVTDIIFPAPHETEILPHIIIDLEVCDEEPKEVWEELSRLHGLGYQSVSYIEGHCSTTSRFHEYLPHYGRVWYYDSDDDLMDALIIKDALELKDFMARQLGYELFNRAFSISLGLDGFSGNLTRSQAWIENQFQMMTSSELTKKINGALKKLMDETGYQGIFVYSEFNDFVK